MPEPSAGLPVIRRTSNRHGPDPLRWVVALRGGVHRRDLRTQDGTELTSTDILSTFSAERMPQPSGYIEA